MAHGRVGRGIGSPDFGPVVRVFAYLVLCRLGCGRAVGRFGPLFSSFGSDETCFGRFWLSALHFKRLLSGPSHESWPYLSAIRIALPRGGVRRAACLLEPTSKAHCQFAGHVEPPDCLVYFLMDLLDFQMRVVA